jgi:hypothetical protein
MATVTNVTLTQIRATGSSQTTVRKATTVNYYIQGDVEDVDYNVTYNASCDLIHSGIQVTQFGKTIFKHPWSQMEHHVLPAVIFANTNKTQQHHDCSFDLPTNLENPTLHATITLQPIPKTVTIGTPASDKSPDYPD